LLIEIIKISSFVGTPFAIRHSPFAIRHSPFAIRHSPFAIRHSPFAIRRRRPEEIAGRIACRVQPYRGRTPIASRLNTAEYLLLLE